MSKDKTGPGEPPWELASREDADHSTPYLVAAALRDGMVTLESFDDSHLLDPELRALMQKVEVVENAAFTQAYERLPQQNHARITVTMNNGQNVTGDAGGDADDLAAPKSAAQIDAKFRGLSEGLLGTRRVDAILARLWALQDVEDMAEIPPLLVAA